MVRSISPKDWLLEVVGSNLRGHTFFGEKRAKSELNAISFFDKKIVSLRSPRHRRKVAAP